MRLSLRLALLPLPNHVDRNAISISFLRPLHPNAAFRHVSSLLSSVRSNADNKDIPVSTIPLEPSADTNKLYRLITLNTHYYSTIHNLRVEQSNHLLP